MKARALIAAIVLSLAVARPAHATDPMIRSMIVGGLYGLVAGTVLGAAATPLARNIRALPIGSSVGLYLGIVVGAFYYTSQQDPINSRASLDGPISPAEGQIAFLNERLNSAPVAPRPLLSFSLEAAHF
jgi:hypothetical protein